MGRRGRTERQSEGESGAGGCGGPLRKLSYRSGVPGKESAAEQAICKEHQRRRAISPAGFPEGRQKNNGQCLPADPDQLMAPERVVSILFSGFWEVFTISLRIFSISSLFSSVRGTRVTGVPSSWVREVSMSLDTVW